MMRTGSRCLAFLPLVLWTTGCASIGLGEPVHQDRPIKTFQVEEPLGGLPRVEVEQKDTRLALTAARPCKVQKKRRVERTTTRERINEQPGKNWALGIAGGVLVGVGTGVIIDAQTNVHPNDDTSRTYNEVGPTNATLIGAGLTAGGVPLLGVALADGIRATGEEVETGVVELDDEVVAERVPCKAHPAAGLPVKIQITRNLGPGSMGGPIINEESFDLGKTDDQGRLKADLEVALAGLDPIMLHGPGVLLVGDDEVGQIDLGPILGQKDEQAWAAVDRESCGDPTTSRSCESVRQYLRDFPQGQHAAEANRIIDKAKPKLDELYDNETWAGSRSEDCNRAPKLDEESKIQSACSGVKFYLSSVRHGEHRADAQKLVDAAEKRIQQLKDKAQKEADAEAKAERDKELKQCRAQCKMVCASWKFDFQKCYSGCVEARCGQ